MDLMEDLKMSLLNVSFFPDSIIHKMLLLLKSHLRGIIDFLKIFTT